MSNIEVGDYIRTKGGLIDIYKEDDGNCMFAGCKKRTYWKLDIVNHSKNIIDLIEVGDYVNGYKVTGVTLDTVNKCVDIDCDKPSYESYLFEEQIYSIVTKEMFLNAEYKVGE